MPRDFDKDNARPRGRSPGRPGGGFGKGPGQGSRDGAPKGRSGAARGPEKKFAKRDGGTSFGDRKPYGDKKPFGDRKPFGDKKPFGEKKPYGDKPYGERKPYAGKRDERPARAFDDRPKRDFSDRPKRDFSDRPKRDFSERPARSFEDRPKRDFSDRLKRDFSDRPKRDFGDRPPRKDFADRGPRKDFADRGPRKDFGDRPPRKDFSDRPKRDYGDRPQRDDARPAARAFGDKKFGDKKFGDKKPYASRGAPDRGPRKDFADRPPRKDFGDKKPYASRGAPDRGPRKDFGDRPPRRDFSERPQQGERKPWQTSSEGSRSDRPQRDGASERPRFSRPRDESRSDRPRSDAPRGDWHERPRRETNERGGWQEHPRSEDRGFPRPRRDDDRPRDSFNDRPRRDNEDDSKVFAKRPAFGGRGEYRERPNRDARGRDDRPRNERPAHKPTPKKDGERIAKLVSRAGLCSRRDAEEWVTQGRVAVNGRVITSPALDVTSRDVVTVDGKPLPAPERTRLFMYHKPRGLMTTHADPEGRPTVFEHLPEGLPRLISVGRLDFNTEGLLLLTNDGGLARTLELPDTGWLRRYRVRAHGEVTQAQLDELQNGVEVDGVKYGPIDAKLEHDQGANVWLVFAIREGKNREVRNVLAHLGLEVNRLIRVSYGPFQLGEIEEGQAEEVKTRVLREQLGEKIAAAAGADFGRTAPSKSDVPDAPVAKKVALKRSTVADRKGRRVVVQRAGSDESRARNEEESAGYGPPRRPKRGYHGKRDLAPRE